MMSVQASNALVSLLEKDYTLEEQSIIRVFLEENWDEVVRICEEESK